MWFPVDFWHAEAVYPMQIGVMRENRVGENFTPFSWPPCAPPGGGGEPLRAAKDCQTTGLLNSLFRSKIPCVTVEHQLETWPRVGKKTFFFFSTPLWRHNAPKSTRYPEIRMRQRLLPLFSYLPLLQPPPSPHDRRREKGTFWMGNNRKLHERGLKSVIPRACAVGWGRHPHHRRVVSAFWAVADIPISILETVQKLQAIEYWPKFFPMII